MPSEKVQQVIPRVIFLVKKNLPQYFKKLTTLKLVPKNRVGHRFQNCFDTWCQNLLVWLSGATCVSNWQKMQILGVVGFKSSTLTEYCLSSQFVHQKLNIYSALFDHCRVSHLSWFQGLKYIPPSFCPQVTNLKKWFLFYTTFSWCKTIEEKTKKHLWRSYKDFGMYNIIG